MLHLKTEWEERILLDNSEDTEDKKDETNLRVLKASALST